MNTMTLPPAPLQFRNYFGITAQDDANTARQKIVGAVVLLDPTLQETLPILFEFMGVSDPNHPPPTIDAEAKQRQLYGFVHRVISAQDAQGQVTVILIDDLHWVDPGSDAFVNQLVSAVAGRRSLIVLNFRPEYDAAFAAKAHYQQLPLVPLGDAPLRELISDLIGSDESVTELSNRIIEWNTGNPFYTEELSLLSRPPDPRQDLPASAWRRRWLEPDELSSRPDNSTPDAQAIQSTGEHRLAAAYDRMTVILPVFTLGGAEIDRKAS